MQLVRLLDGQQLCCPRFSSQGLKGPGIWGVGWQSSPSPPDSALLASPALFGFTRKRRGRRRRPGVEEKSSEPKASKKMKKRGLLLSSWPPKAQKPPWPLMMEGQLAFNLQSHLTSGRKKRQC